MAERFKTPVGIISYPNLWTPQPKGGVKGADLVYSASLVFTNDDVATAQYKAMKEKIDEEIDAYAQAKKVKTSQVRSPLLDAKDKYGSQVDGALIYISPWSKFKPEVLDENKPAQPILSANDIHAGMKARLLAKAFGWTNSGKHGVSLQLEGVQVYVGIEMPRLDGRRSAAADFDDDGDDEF